VNKSISALVFLAVGLVFSLPLSAQDKSKADEVKADVHPTPVKIQVVFAEFEGDKKIKSMPYISQFTADAPHGLEFAKLRIGNRVPLYTGKENGLQYADVGMNIDLRAERLDDGRFGIRIALERSWVEGDVLIPVAKTADAQTGGSSGEFKEPVIGQYKTDLYLLMRDGQTVESTLATDPLSGRLLKIEFTLTVVK
jgi:hypothetical protein